MSFFSKLSPERKYEILGVLVLALTTFLFLALVTDGYQGDSRRSLSDLGSAPNALGAFGAFVAGTLYVFVGQAAHVLYFLTCVWGMMFLRHRPVDRFSTRIAGFFLLTFSVAGLLHVDFSVAANGHFPGGAIGAFVAKLIEPHFGIVGSNVIMVTLSLVGLLLATEFLFVRLTAGAVSAFFLTIRSLAEMSRTWRRSRIARRQVARRQAACPDGLLGVDDAAGGLPAGELPFGKSQAGEASDGVDDLSRIRVRPDLKPVEIELPFDVEPELEKAPARPQPEETGFTEPEKERLEEPAPVGEVPLPEPAEGEPVLEGRQAEGPAKEGSAKTLRSSEAKTSPRKKARLRRKSAFEEQLPFDYTYPKRYTRPSVAMLEEPPEFVRGDLTESLRHMGVLLEETLQTFSIEARVTDITRGPTITRFEVEPAPGVKVSRFMALADDLALALKADRVRVEAPIPGKGKVGIEVPNDEREAVVIRELLESKAYRKAKGKLTLGLGKDIAGDVVVTDLTAMPHLLVAGATGAGKTVCVKTILASLLFSRTPDELQLILIDPKMVELSIFNDIPHLITPVVIDPKKAATALTWLINEMEERYRLFAHLRVRNIEVYNQSVDNGEIEMTDGSEGGVESISAIRKLPYIVCIIDELADLMMMARSEVEDAIARLAQLARAVGIHLIIATQRPSVDVLTGVIKANFPARISFQVSSRVDSRCILDEIGAERLIGRGDMLYLPPGQSKPTRIQAGFVSDEEMNSLIAYLKTQAPPQYRDEIERFGKQQETLNGVADESDELFEDAVQVVVETGQASISMVQRRLRVGYTRAARLIDMMEMKGIVGPHVGSKAREILVPLAQENDEVA